MSHEQQKGNMDSFIEDQLQRGTACAQRLKEEMDHPAEAIVMQGLVNIARYAQKLGANAVVDFPPEFYRIAQKNPLVWAMYNNWRASPDKVTHVDFLTHVIVGFVTQQDELMQRLRDEVSRPAAAIHFPCHHGSDNCSKYFAWNVCQKGRRAL